MINTDNGTVSLCEKRFLKETGKTKKQIQKENEEAAEEKVKAII